MEEEEKNMSQDTEITLGTGKLLGIFFGLVVICGAFFTLGYLLGHSTGAAGASTQIVGSATTPAASSAGKPSGVNKAPETTVQNCPPGSPNCTPASGPDSTFVNSVSNKTPNNQLTPAPAPSTTPVPAANPAPTPTGAGGPYMVQVAAVSKQEDAETLVSALRKKQYPVFSATQPGDSLYHVQVGPFADLKEADAMRVRLAGDGYNAIVKK
jgi:cell division septation protein DedD